jgi:chaperonin cofactor prefoldin
MGVVAQELRLTSPNLIDECVGKDGEITLGVKQSIIFMKAAKALQEAMERIETLEAKVTALENK